MDITQLSISLRPQRLEDVFGQQGVVKELLTRQKDNKWPRAMLFKGLTGTGKTTCAQLVAMAIQCKNPGSNNSPCGICDECMSIRREQWDRGTELLDAGADSGKQDIQNLLQGADTASFYGPKKVFIIEESDQLSKAAMNSLLKILEKPNANVHFILLSMLSGGVPPAIQSRCQTFNFKPFMAKDIMFALKGSMEKLNLWTDPSIPDDFRIKGLGTIALASLGSLREATQLLEKCLVGKYFTAEEIRANLGIIDEETITSALEKLMKRDVSFFNSIDGLDLTEFFNIAYTALSDAYVYSLTEFIKNEYFEGQVKSLSSYTTLPELVALFNGIQEESHGYIKKAYFMNKLAAYFSKTNKSQTASKVSNEAARLTRQEELDKAARERAGVEVTGLGPRTSGGRIPV